MRRYRCIKECTFNRCDEDGFVLDDFNTVERGSIWQEDGGMISGGKDNVHLEREDTQPGKSEWCEPLKETLAECFEEI